MTGLLIMFLTAAASLIAAPIDCASGTLDDYISLPSDGCRVGSIVVSDFLNPGVLPGSTELDPSDVSVVPLAGNGNPGLRFTYNASAASGQVFQSVVQFQVSSVQTVRGTLRMVNGRAAPLGATAVTSEFCFGNYESDLCTGTATVLGTFDIGGDSDDFDRIDLAPVNSFAVRHDAVIDAASGASAFLQSAELRFAQVPEPATGAAVLTAIGLWLLLAAAAAAAEPFSYN